MLLLIYQSPHASPGHDDLHPSADCVGAGWGIEWKKFPHSTLSCVVYTDLSDAFFSGVALPVSSARCPQRFATAYAGSFLGKFLPDAKPARGAKRRDVVPNVSNATQARNTLQI